MCVCVCVCVWFTSISVSVCLSLSLSLYIYIYIYISVLHLRYFLFFMYRVQQNDLSGFNREEDRQTNRQKRVFHKEHNPKENKRVKFTSS